MSLGHSVLVMIAAVGAVAFGARPAPPVATSADAAPAPDAPVPASSHGVAIAPGRTTIVRVEPDVGQPLEREPELVAKVPSYRRAVDLDRDQRWAESASLYQQALGEVGLAARLTSPSLWERAAFKIELERRRSRALAQAAATDHLDEPARAAAAGPRGAPPMLPTSALDRARLLRLKLMAIRSATGAVPAGLVSTTLGALQLALHRSGSTRGARASEAAGTSRDDDDTSEIRLLLCATRAVSSDRPGARLELAHVPLADRTDPARALALAICQAALGYKDDALASLAVAIYRLGPSPRFLPGQTRELESSNDWDPLRADPRFERLFR